jgi:8-oxo-dGTP diphosphatase
MLIDKVAWVRVERGAVLCARSAGKALYYLPGGKRESGETDVQTLVREIGEELGVTITPGTAEEAGVFEARADGRADAVTVRLTCYFADYSGVLAANGEIAEFAWLSYADRERVSAASGVVFEWLRGRGTLG